MGLGELPRSSCQPAEQGRERRRSRCGLCATRAALLRPCGAGEVPVGEPVGLEGDVASSTQTQLGNKTSPAPLWAGGWLRCLTGRCLPSKFQFPNEKQRTEALQMGRCFHGLSWRSQPRTASPAALLGPWEPSTAVSRDSELLKPNPSLPPAAPEVLELQNPDLSCVGRGRNRKQTQSRARLCRLGACRGPPGQIDFSGISPCSPAGGARGGSEPRCLVQFLKLCLVSLPTGTRARLRDKNV